MKVYCDMGKHKVDEGGFSKSQLKQTHYKGCIACRKKYWEKYKKKREKENKYDNMFFNFRGE